MRLPNRISREEKIWRFWSRVERTGWDRCWKWHGHKNPKGYGKFSAHLQLGDDCAHRISYMLQYGNIPIGAHILHHCDNPECTNPTHLYAGTPFDNMRDKVLRGRVSRLLGTEHPNAKLSDEKVAEIRRRYSGGSGRPYKPNNQVSLAKEFGVSVTVINKVLHGKSWTHV